MTQQIVQLWIGKWRSLIEIILLSVGLSFWFDYRRRGLV